jgi:hypothetical protein
MSVGDYTTKFEALIRFCPHYSTAEAELSKCVKFEDGLRPEIKQFIAYRQIRRFSDLVDACRIYEKSSQERSNHYKPLSEKKHLGQNRGKPYDRRDQKSKSATAGKGEASGGGKSNSPRCFKCGEAGHRVFECNAENPKCFRCGKPGHSAFECKGSNVICFSCGEPGHISTNCGKHKKESEAAPTTARVFALSGEEEDANTDNLI